MIFKQQIFLYFGVLLFIAWSCGYWKIFKKTEIIIPKRYQKSKKLFLRWIIYFIVLLAWSSLTISMMGPRRPIGNFPDEVEVNDIYFVVDVSKSMTAVDFKPNRLIAAKEKIKSFIKQRNRDRVGIIMFSEKAFTLLPLTLDNDLVIRMVDKIETGFLGSGTNIGDALGLAVARGKFSTAKNKIIILLTDGVSNIGSMTPMQAANEAKNHKMKIYSIGIGSKKGAMMPMGTNKWSRKRLVHVPGGGINTESLKQISQITNGKSYYAKDRNALNEIFNYIQKLEKTKIKIYGKIRYKEEYIRYLIAGIGLFLFATGLRIFWSKEEL